MTPLDTIAAELALPPDVYSDVSVRRYAKELLAEVVDLQSQIAGALEALRMAGEGVFAAPHAEVERLRAINEGLVNRLAGTVELLCKKANRLPALCPACGHAMQFGDDV